MYSPALTVKHPGWVSSSILVDDVLYVFHISPANLYFFSISLAFCIPKLNKVHEIEVKAIYEGKDHVPNRRALKGTPQPNVILETTGMSPTSIKHHWSLRNHDIFWGTNGLLRYASPHCRESTTKRLSFLQNGALIESLPLVVRSNMECIPQKTVSNDFLIWNSMSCIPCFNLQSVAFIDVPCTIADQESHQFRNQNTHLLWWHTPSEHHQGAVKTTQKKTHKHKCK